MGREGGRGRWAGVERLQGGNRSQPCDIYMVVWYQGAAGVWGPTLMLANQSWDIYL